MDEVTHLAQQVQIKSRARPVRVAYLVEDGKHSGTMLDAIFAEAYGRWAGMRTLIVPVEEQRISKGYWSWLRWYDPDVVYSFQPISEELVAQLDREVMPAHLVVHEESRIRDLPPIYRPRLPVGALSALVVLPVLSTRSGTFSTKPRSIIDRYPAWEDDGFVKDNFGTSYDSLTVYPLNEAVLQYVTPLLLTPKDAPDNRWHMRIGGEEIEDDRELLRQMAKDGSITSFARLSATFGASPAVRHNKWRNSLNLVVGDSFVDRLVFWNGRLLLEDWQTDQLVALRVPRQRLDDDDFVDALCEFVRRWNWMSSGSRSGQGDVTVRSHSLGDDELKAVSEELRAKLHTVVTHESIRHADDVVPPAGNLERHVRWFKEQSRQYVSQRRFLLDSPHPFPLIDLPTVPPHFRSGVWMIDAKIQRHNDLSRFSNVQHWWCLPRKQQVLRLFLQPTKGMNIREARINLDGMICFETEYPDSTREMSLPDDREVFVSLLVEPVGYLAHDARSSNHPRTCYQFVRRSDKGRYLEGALGLFGGIHEAETILGDAFWRRVIGELSEPIQGGVSDQDDALIERLQKRLRATKSRLRLHSQDDWRAVADAVRKEARRLRTPERFAKFAVLQRRAEDCIKQCIEANTQLNGHEAEILERMPEELDDALQSLCNRGVFSQGHEWRCVRCGYRNWRTVDEMRMLSDCAVCGEPHQVPSTLEWKFRLNDFLSESIREHGISALLWVLARLSEHVHESFFFSPPLELFDKYPKTEKAGADSEIDILCVVDGKLVVGEVKRTAGWFKRKDARSLARVATRIGADVVLLGCFEPAARMMETRKRWVERELNGFPCEVAVLCPRFEQLEPNHYVPGL